MYVLLFVIFSFHNASVTFTSAYNEEEYHNNLHQRSSTRWSLMASVSFWKKLSFIYGLNRT